MCSFIHSFIHAESLCTQAPEFQLPSGGQSEVWETLGSFVALNCTALLSWNQTDQRCDATSRTLLWSKDGTPLNLSLYPQNTSTWTPSQSQMMVSSVLQVQLREQADFGLYSCEVRNTSADFILQNTGHPSHTAAVIAAISLLLILTIAAVVYSRCRLNIKLWYRNSYGDYEINDGKQHDAYFSYVDNQYDRKLVNFILKPHLVNKSGHKLHLSDNNILPGGEPSAEFLMNVSHCRRLIVVMSHAYLEQDWCCNNFRQGLLHLLELSQRPIIIITLEGQVKLMRPDVVQQLKEHQHKLTLLTWSGSHSMVTQLSLEPNPGPNPVVYLYRVRGWNGSGYRTENRRTKVIYTVPGNRNIILKAWEPVNNVILRSRHLFYLLFIFIYFVLQKMQQSTYAKPSLCHSGTYSSVCLSAEHLVCVCRLPSPPPPSSVGYLPLPPVR
uniref:Single immunoglobulin and toll-interleukin 1 receptor (TIR) domain n=1 Tax=Hucho hucho TaxID=62062 RepID=A0A4W5K4E7_9TELE